MRSDVDVTNQAVSSVSNTVTFSHVLIYVSSELSNSLQPEDLVLSPWKDIVYSNSLAEQLKQELPEAFGDLGTPITTPAIFAPVDVVDNEDGGSSKSLYALTVLALIPLVVICYIFYRRRDHPRLAHAGDELESIYPQKNQQARSPEPAVRSELPSAQTVATEIETMQHFPDYKDQCRPVQSDADQIPLAAAILLDQSTDKQVGS